MGKLKRRRQNRHGLDNAVRLFEEGSIEHAAKRLRKERQRAKARGRDDIRTEIDETVLQMRAYLNREERQTFDALYKPNDVAHTGWRTALGNAVFAPVAAAIFFLYYVAGYALAIFVALPLSLIQRLVSAHRRLHGREPRTLKAKAAVDARLDKWFDA